MKKLIILTCVLLVGIVLPAQEIFFPTKEGAVLTYKTFDKKDKETNVVRYTIKDLKVSGSDMVITYQYESVDPKGKVLYVNEITIHQKGDKLYFDMSNFVNKAMFQQNAEISPEIEIVGNNMEIPSHPKPGNVLPDASVEISMNMGFVNLKVTANVTNRKVEAIESIAVKAGTYNAYKFSSEVSSSAMGIKVKSRNIEWYVKGVGMVKSEQYDKKDKLQSYTELIEMKM